MDLLVSIPLTETKSLRLGLPVILFLFLFGLSILVSIYGALAHDYVKTRKSRYKLAKRGLAVHPFMAVCYGFVAILSVIGLDWLVAAMAIILAACHWFHVWKINNQ
nr:hypothetical protein [Brucella anthropi]